LRIAATTLANAEQIARAATQLEFDGLLITGESLHRPDLVLPALPPGLKLLLDADLSAFPIDHLLVKRSPELFELRRQRAGEGPIDPRRPAPAQGEARARLRSPQAAEALLPALGERLRRLVEAGVSGFRIVGPQTAEPAILASLLGELRHGRPDMLLIAQTPGVPREQAMALEGFDFLVSSFAWWDLAEPWLVEEHEALRMRAPLLAEMLPAPDDPDAIRQRLMAAAVSAHGLIVPGDLLLSAPQAVREASALLPPLLGFGGEMRHLSTRGGVTAILRVDAPDVRDCREAALILINRTDAEASPAVGEILAGLGVDLQPFRSARGAGDPFAPLLARELRLLSASRARPIALRRHGGGRSARDAAARPRLVIGCISPDVDEGAFPAKATVGDQVLVEANLFADGHEQLAAELRWRAADEKEWRRTPMEQLPNDRWRAAMPLERLGRHEFVIEGWLDVYGGYRRDFNKKLDAGVAQEVDYQEGRRFVDQALKHASGDVAERLKAQLARLNAAGTLQEAAAILLGADLAAAMDEADQRPFAITSSPRRIDAERLQARFSSWYELFPRSQTDDPARHGNFDDVVRQLPRIRAMGFDTLYFPPIHPIGRAFRKGPNNSLEAGPDDPGSPYAIGGEEGGHDAVHPELGTIEDFRRLVRESRRHGLEIALDFAIQCSPDHPWLKQHPGWFDYRPDGSIKYAENPPKKYQDIVNVDFYKPEAVPDLWVALRDVVLFWANEGVRTFRVDNPHTKPLPFWEWMIADLRGVHPDLIFLSEAFTRPNMMYRLAKIGFSQSYTYFTWRDTKQELTEYLTELTTTDVRHFYRPHFFVNTPDINPIFLQTSGPPGFRIRAALAATLSGLFGVYSGFELCEGQPVPGKEEYWDSEKYIVKPRDWSGHQPNIIADISLLNRLRRAYPPLQTHLNVTFYNASNEQILYYGKRLPGSDEMILVAISLDPHNAQSADIEFPLWEFGLPDHGALPVEDLVAGGRALWHGKHQRVALTPDRPYAIWRVAPAEAAA
jgi:starch synthase (maltosyl-transferring)